MKTIRVAAALIVKGNTLLATQRGYGEFEGQWEFPGGKIEPGETPEEALVRELHEELAADIAIDRPFLTIDYDYPSFHLRMDCFLCTLASDRFTLLEHHAARWLGAGELFSVPWLPADIQIIKKIRDKNVLKPTPI